MIRKIRKHTSLAFCASLLLLAVNFFSPVTGHWSLVIGSPSDPSDAEHPQDAKHEFRVTSDEKEVIRVPLTVEETAGVVRLGWPVTTGVPFPQGLLKNEENVRLLDAAGREVPLQSRILGLWPDRSIRWLLLDFQIDLVPQEKGMYFLEIGPEVKRTQARSSLRIKRTSRGKEIDAGNIMVSLETSEFSIYDMVVLAGAPKWTGRRRRVPLFGPTRPFVEFVGSKGPPVEAGERETNPQRLSIRVLTVEEVERGPLRLKIKMKGNLLSPEGRVLLEYQSRLEAYARKPFIRVLFTFINKSPEDYLSIRELSLISLLAFTGDKRFEIGAEGEIYEGEVLRTGGGRILQDTYNSYEVTERETSLGQGERAAGWIDMSGLEGGLLVVLPFFREEYSKALEAKEGALQVSLWPGDAEVSPLKFVQGVAKSCEIYYLFHPAGMSSEEMEKEARALAHPLIATCPSCWYAASGVFGELSARDLEVFGDLEKALEDAVRNFLKRREESEDYGMLDFGDYSIPSGEAAPAAAASEASEKLWGNLEYDLTETLCLLFAHTGEARYFREARVAARHFMDVDVVHYNYMQPFYEGGVHSPKEFHTGFPEVTSPGLENARIGGLLLYYYLSGEERALEVAGDISRYLARAPVARIGRGRISDLKEIGSALISLSTLYKATGDRELLSFARRYASLAISLQDPASGGFLVISEEGLPIEEREGRRPGPGPYGGGRAGRTAKVTRDEAELGVLLEGLRLFHQITGDEAVKRCIIKAAVFITDILESRDPRSLPAIFYIYTLSGDEKFLDWSKKTAERAVKMGLAPGGDVLAYGVRSLLRYQYFLNNLESIQAEIAKKIPEIPPEAARMERDCKRWISLADSWLMAGETARALEYYLKIVETYPESPYASEAREKIKRIDETLVPE